MVRGHINSQELREKLVAEAERKQWRLKLLNGNPRLVHEMAKESGWQDEWDTNVSKAVIVRAQSMHRRLNNGLKNRLRTRVSKKWSQQMVAQIFSTKWFH
jgi:hypothetical protein